MFYTCYLRGSRALLHALDLSHRHVLVFSALAVLALLAAHGAAVTPADLVGLAGFHVLLKRLGLALKLVNSLLLLRHGSLHLVKHSHLLLFESLDSRLSCCLLSLVLLLLLNVSLSRRLVVLVSVLARLTILLLPLRIHV